MSDNVTTYDFSNKQQRKRILLLVIAAAVVVLALVLLLFAETLNLDAIGRGIKYIGAKEENLVFSFDAHGTNRFARCGDGLAVASASGLKTMNSRGQTVLTVDQSLSAPAVQTGGGVTAIWDIGGSTLTAARKKVTLQFRSDGAILDADVSSGGAVCVASSESGYKTVLRAYDANGKETYRWFSSSRFFPVCAVSPSGKQMAAISLGQSGGVFESTINWFKTTREDVQKSASLGDRLVYELYFMNENRAWVVCEDAIYCAEPDGSLTQAADLSGQYLADYDLGGDGCAVLALNLFQAGNRFMLRTVKPDGTVLGERDIEGEILDISACGKYVAVLTAERLLILHRNLSDYASAENTDGASKVLMRADGSAILISDRSAATILP